MLTAYEIADRMFAICKTLESDSPRPLSPRMMEARDDLEALAVEVLADSAEARKIAATLNRALSIVRESVQRAGDEDGLPHPRVQNGWTFHVTQQCDALYRIASRRGSNILIRPNLSAAAVRAFDAEHEWRAGVPE